MTLVLGCTIRRNAVLVSDRLVTYADGRVENDGRNKAILFDGSFAISHSGLAYIDGIPTDTWIATTLAQARDDHFMYLAQSAKAAIESHRPPLPRQLQRTAFCALGWFHEEGRFIPAWRIASNAVNPYGLWDPVPRPWDVFYCDVPDVDVDECFGIAPPIGAEVPRTVLKRFERDLRRAYEHRASAHTIATLMARTIRRVADRDPRVGRDVLVMIVPCPLSKPASRAFHAVTPHDPSSPSFYEDEKRTWFFPNYVKDGWAITDFS